MTSTASAVSSATDLPRRAGALPSDDLLRADHGHLRPAGGAGDHDGDAAVEGGEASRLFVNALARGLQVLAGFRAGQPWMSMNELAHATGLSRSAVQRFTYTLLQLGYLIKHPGTKEYALAPRALEVGMRYLQTNPIVSAANPYLHTLTRNCEETSLLAERDGHDIVYIARFPAHKEMFVNMPIGMRLPMYCSSAGRAIMAHLPPAQVQAILDSSPLTAYTDSTLTDPDHIWHAVQQTQRQGFAVCNGEYYVGDITIGAAIVGPSGQPWGAVCLSAPSSRWTVDEAAQVLGPQAVEAARAIGYQRIQQQRKTTRRLD